MTALVDALTRDLRFIANNFPLLADGFAMTLMVAGASALAGIVWAVCLASLRLSHRPDISLITLSYIELVRNTPLLVQVYLSYFGLPLIGLKLSAFACGVIGIAGQHGAFIAEVLRAAILSVGKEQREAALSLGLTNAQTMRLVIAPQALRSALPSLSGQMLLLIKDSVVVAGIGIVELTLAGKIIIERSAATYQVFIVIAIGFFLLNGAAAACFRVLERRWAIDGRS
jgi:polar amino acid transport system permease protein